MTDQVIWARAIVPFLVYDWSYILTFVFYFLRLQKDHVESKLLYDPKKILPKKWFLRFYFIAVCFFLPFLFRKPK